MIIVHGSFQYRKHHGGLAVTATAVAAVLLKLAAIQLAQESADELELGLAHLVGPDQR